MVLSQKSQRSVIRNWFYQIFILFSHITFQSWFTSLISYKETLWFNWTWPIWWEHIVLVVLEGGGKCEIHQLMSQGTSEAQIKHKTITYDRPTLCRNGFLGWFDSIRIISDQTTFLTLGGNNMRERERKLNWILTPCWQCTITTGNHRHWISREQLDSRDPDRERCLEHETFSLYLPFIFNKTIAKREAIVPIEKKEREREKVRDFCHLRSSPFRCLSVFSFGILKRQATIELSMCVSGCSLQGEVEMGRLCVPHDTKTCLNDLFRHQK